MLGPAFVGFRVFDLDTKGRLRGDGGPARLAWLRGVPGAAIRRN
jgi:hypothetical protein